MNLYARIIQIYGQKEAEEKIFNGFRRKIITLDNYKQIFACLNMKLIGSPFIRPQYEFYRDYFQPYIARLVLEKIKIVSGIPF